MKINIKILVIIILFFIGMSDAFSQQQGNQNNNQGIQLPSVNFNVDVDDESDDLVLKLQILAVMTVLTLAPSILVMMTAFTRIIVVFHFLKQALGTHTQPPNQLLTSLALFLTFSYANRCLTMLTTTEYNLI
jgi:flagellar biosynthetic protein FliP